MGWTRAAGRKCQNPAHGNTNRHARRLRKRRLLLERLEERTVLSQTPLAVVASGSTHGESNTSRAVSIQQAISEVSYLVSGQHVSLEVVDALVAIKVTDSQLSRELALACESGGQFAGRQVQRRIAEDVFELAGDGVESLLSADDRIDWIVPAYRIPSTGSKTYILDEAVVAVRPGTTLTEILADEAVRVRPLKGTSDQFIVTLPEPGPAVLRFVNRLADDERVAWASPNMFQDMQRFSLPDDPLFANQWHLQNTGTQVLDAIAGADIKVVPAWDYSTGQGTTIAVLDMGVELSHPDLADNLFMNPGEIMDNGLDDDGNGWVDDFCGWSFVSDSPAPHLSTSDWHGTSVAGVAAATGNNGLGVTGAAYRAKIMPLQIFGMYGYVGDADTASAIYYAAGRTADGLGTWNAANVINCSWGGGAPTDILDAAFTWASNSAHEGRGVPTFAATGNEYKSTIIYPATLSATLPGVIAVGASNHRDQRSEYSNYGSQLDVLAPSSDDDRPYLVGITTTDRVGAVGYAPGNYTDNTLGDGFRGTSSATALASGVGALMMSMNLDFPAAQVKQVLRATADKVGGVVYDAQGFNLQYGYGRINAFAAVQLVDLTVADTFPAEGDVVTAKPLFDGGYVVDFVSPISLDPDDIHVSGVKINGVSAIGYTIVDADTLAFTFAEQPITADGLQEWTIDAGTVKRAIGGKLLEEYHGSFRYDSLPLQVAGTIPALDSVVELPFSILDLDFNEAIDPESVQAADFAVNLGHLDSVEVVDSDTVRLTLSGLAREATLTVEAPAAAWVDVYGNPSLAFQGTYHLDYRIEVFPTPFRSVVPLGARIHEQSHVGTVNASGDQDVFVLTLDANQLVTVAVLPTEGSLLQPRVTLVAPSGARSSADAAGPGLTAALQVIPTPDVGEYQIIVEGANAETVGGYRVQVILNAATEVESNDSLATAQSLDAAFVNLFGIVSQAAVVGRSDTVYVHEGFESGDFSGLNWSMQGSSEWFVTQEGARSGNFSARPKSLYEWGWAELHLYITTVEAPIEFSSSVLTQIYSGFLDFLIDDARADLWSGEVPFDRHSYLLTAGEHKLTWHYHQPYNDPLGLHTAYLDDVSIPVAHGTDCYSFSLAQGEMATIALTGLAHSTGPFGLRDATGNVVAMSTDASENADQVILDFVSATPGINTYYIVAQPSGEYSLVVTKNATFDVDANNSAETSQVLLGSQDVVGYLGPKSVYVTDGFESGRLDQLPWVGSGDLGWYVSYEYASEGSYSASSGAIMPGQVSNLSLTLTTGPGLVSFDKRIGINPNVDDFQVFVDGELIYNWSMNAATFSRSDFRVSAGLHTLMWSRVRRAETSVWFGGTRMDQVSIPLSAPGVDWYSVTLDPGNTELSVTSQTPDVGAVVPDNALRPSIELYDSTGTTLIAAGVALAEGRNQKLLASGLIPGVSYRIKVTGEEETVGEYYLDVEQAPPPPAELVSRQIFYNDSLWDGSDPAAGAADDGAIASDKQALVEGQLASATNYSSYCRGINGIMVDMAGLTNPAGLSASDFEFRVGNTADPKSWPLLELDPSDITVAVRPGAGTAGSDRVTMLFPDGVIQNTWLQVKVKANANTRLAAEDVHYWGHALGETGDVVGDTLVDDYDVAGVLANPHTSDDPAALDDLYDFNRDRLVDAVDEALARTSATTPATMLGVLDLRTADVPAITVSVSPAAVLEDGAENLVYTFARSGDVSAAITVPFRVTGSALFASDYTTTGATSFEAKVGTVTFAAGSATATVTIDPTADATVELDETTWLVALPSPTNAASPPAHASGTIQGDDTLQVVQTVIQDGNVQRSIITQLRVQFNAEVAIAADAFHLVNRDTRETVTTSLSTSVIDGRTTVTLTFLNGPSVHKRKFDYGLVDGNYHLTIDSDKITYLSLQLDGDRDGTAGGDYVFGATAADRFFRFYGNTDADRDVDGSDLYRLGLTFRKVQGQAGFNPYLDYDGDGDVDGQDYYQFSLRFRKFLSLQ